MELESTKEIQEKMEKQKLAIRELMTELDGKTMNYETCRMLEDFLNEYTEIMLKEIEKAVVKIKENFDLIPKRKLFPERKKKGVKKQ